MISPKRQSAGQSQQSQSANVPVRVQGYTDYVYSGKTNRAILGINELTGEKGLFVQYEPREQAQDQSQRPRASGEQSFERPTHEAMEKGYTAGTEKRRIGADDMLIARAARRVGETEIDGEKLPVYRYEWPNTLVFTKIMENRAKGRVEEIEFPGQDEDCVHRGIAMMRMSHPRDPSEAPRAYVDLLRFDESQPASAEKIASVVHSFSKDSGNQSFLIRALNEKGEVAGALPPISRTWKASESGEMSRLSPEDSAREVAAQVLKEMPGAASYEIVPGDRFHVSRMALNPGNTRNRVKYFQGVSQQFNVDLGAVVEQVAREVVVKTGLSDRSQNTLNHLFILEPNRDGLDPALIGKNRQMLHYTPEYLEAVESLKASARTVQSVQAGAGAPELPPAHQGRAAEFEPPQSATEIPIPVAGDEEDPFSFVDDPAP